MVRLAAVFIAVCMALIAASIGAVLYLTAGFSAVEASLVALAVLTSLAIYNAATNRLSDREGVSGQIADLSRGTADLARQVGEFGQRLNLVEDAVVAASDKAQEVTQPLATEIQDLGALVKRLADSVAAQEAALAGAVTAASILAESPAPKSVSAPAASEPADAIDPAEIEEPKPARGDSGRFKGMDHGQVLALITGAVDANRVDLYLQPIVSLPQRKVRFYEALTRLRAEDGEVLLPADFLAVAESGGLMPKIDNLLLFRCVQVVRRLVAKNREIGLFCNISGSTLLDPEFFPQLSEFMQANRAIAPSLVLEFAQTTVRNMGPLEHESLAALSELGFRFSLDRLNDLRIEPRELADRGFRYVKVPGKLLLNRAGPAADIHPADFSDLLGRFGIDLIAERIESEGMVVDLLDYDVRFGQGFLFAAPKPVRVEALQGTTEAREPVVETPSPAAEAPAVQPVAPPSPERRGALSQLARGAVRRA